MFELFWLDLMKTDSRLRQTKKDSWSQTSFIFHLIPVTCLSLMTRLPGGCYYFLRKPVSLVLSTCMPDQPAQMTTPETTGRQKPVTSFECTFLFARPIEVPGKIGSPGWPNYMITTALLDPSLCAFHRTRFVVCLLPCLSGWYHAQPDLIIGPLKPNWLVVCTPSDDCLFPLKCRVELNALPEGLLRAMRRPSIRVFQPLERIPSGKGFFPFTVWMTFDVGK